MRRLTLKQSRFAKEYVANGGNGTQAALKVYNSDDYDTAAHTAEDNLKHPQIQQEVEHLANQEGVTRSTILRKFNHISSKEAEKWSGDTILKANIQLASILGMYPGSKHTNLNVSIKGDLAKMKYQDAKEALNKLRGTNNTLIEEIESPPTDTE